MFQIFTLCSDNEDKLQQTKVFLNASLPVATKENEIRPLFHKAITRAKTYSGTTQAEDDDHNSVILHLPFQTNDPASSRIQAEWRTHVDKPQWKLPLVCVCVCVCVFTRYLNRANACSLFTPHAKNTLHIKIYTQHNFPILQHYRAVLPYQPAREKMTFEFLLRFSEFYFLFSAIPTGNLIFCLAADKATAKSVTKYSPTDSEKQTAVVCKDNGLFFDKDSALSKPTTL